MSSPFTHILVVDDDARLRSLLKQYLGDQGYTVTAAKDAADARRKMAMFLFDLVVLDVMMPGETGVEFARFLQEKNPPPILMLTAMGEVGQRIEGLEAGADDYLAKPFEPRELSLRVKKLLHRSAPPSQEASARVTFGDYVFDVFHQTLEEKGQGVYLTTSEAQLLFILASKAGQPVSRSDLARELKLDTGNERGVDVQITRLRKKIEPDTAHPIHIQTVRGEGYVLKATSPR